MRKKRPRIARLDQVRISREAEDAIIEFRDSSIATTHLRVGPQVHQMTDEEILLVFNRTIAAQIRNRDELGEYVAIEVPVGSPQFDYHADTVNQWSPRGEVLRCYIEDGGGEDGSLPVIHIDDREFTWDEFGRMLCTYAGWGMRIVFVPDDELEQVPEIAVWEPNEVLRSRGASHNMHPFIDVLLAAAEKPDKDGQSLADRLRDSFDAKLGTYNGTLVNELMTVIDAVVEETPTEEVRAAYNLLAEQHGIDSLKEGEELGGPYSDMFLEAVLDAIWEKRS